MSLKTHLKLHSPIYHSISTTRPKFINTLHGRNVKLSNDCDIAYRETNETLSHAYVFIDEHFSINESICLQILNVDSMNEMNKNISLSFGCTNSNLKHIKQNDLPNDSYKLLNRNEYWIVNKSILNNAEAGDELCLKITENGNIEYYVNGKLRTNVLFNVDTSQNLYFFFDVCGKTTAIRLLQSCNKTKKIHLSQEHAVINTDLHSNSSVKFGECSICLDRPVDCVIYSCGHMCFCWICAFEMKKSKLAGQCPICRSNIVDIIKIYK